LPSSTTPGSDNGPKNPILIGFFCASEIEGIMFNIMNEKTIKIKKMDSLLK
jgi:hypothetical protein